MGARNLGHDKEFEYLSSGGFDSGFSGGRSISSAHRDTYIRESSSLDCKSSGIDFDF